MTPFQVLFQEYGAYLWLITMLTIFGTLFWIYRIKSRYARDYGELDRLLRGSRGGTEGLQELLNRLGQLERDASQLEVMRTAMRELELRQNHSFQAVGLVRFNPFSDMGGDQSFALSIVDSYGDGFVMSSLHGRTATRMYAKVVRRGQSSQTISTEEQAAIDQAMRFQQLPPDTSISVKN